MSTDSRERPGSAMADPDWISPTVDPGGITQYVEALRGAWWLVVASVICCVGAGAFILSRADKVYESSAFLVVSPVSDREGDFAGLSILRESSDPARNLETLARTITTATVARRVKAKLKSPETPRSLLSRIDAVPVAQSDLLEIKARAGTPEFAQQLANTFATEAIAHRTTQLHHQVDRLIAGLRPLARRNRSNRGAAAEPDGSQRLVAERLAQLEALRVGPDPTVRLEEAAQLPRSPSSPKPLLSILVSLVAGLLIGVGGVFGMQMIDPRVRSERQLRQLYRLPVLARVPKIRRPFGFGSRAAEASAKESYQALRTALMGAAAALGPGNSVLVTGPSRRDGKTATSIGVARALAQSGQRTTLVEADARRPAVGSAIGISSAVGLLAVVSGTMPTSAALVHPEREPTSLNVLLAEHSADWLPDVLVPTAADRLLHELDEMSDWIIIDSPPLGQVLDTLPLALLADQLVLVVRLGKSQLNELKLLTEVLAQYAIRPTGFVVVGGSQMSYGYR